MKRNENIEQNKIKIKNHLVAQSAIEEKTATNVCPSDNNQQILPKWYRCTIALIIDAIRNIKKKGNASECKFFYTCSSNERNKSSTNTVRRLLVPRSLILPLKLSNEHICSCSFMFVAITNEHERIFHFFHEHERLWTKLCERKRIFPFFNEHERSWTKFCEHKRTWTRNVRVKTWTFVNAWTSVNVQYLQRI